MIFFSVSKKWVIFRFQPFRMQFEDGAVPSMPSGMATSAAASLGVAGSTPLAQCSLVWKPKGKNLEFQKLLVTFPSFSKWWCNTHLMTGRWWWWSFFFHCVNLSWSVVRMAWWLFNGRFRWMVGTHKERSTVTRVLD